MAGGQVARCARSVSDGGPGPVVPPALAVSRPPTTGRINGLVALLGLAASLVVVDGARRAARRRDKLPDQQARHAGLSDFGAAPHYASGHPRRLRLPGSPQRGPLGEDL